MKSYFKPNTSYICTIAAGASFVKGKTYYSDVHGKIYSERGIPHTCQNGSSTTSTFEEIEKQLTISMDKEYTTRDGQEVRIYAIDGGGGYPVHGAYLLGNEWFMQNWKLSGEFGVSDRARDLIEKPCTAIRYIAIYDNCISGVNYSKKFPDIENDPGFLRWVEVTINLN